eukprot:INCI3675.2.p1 GENE.INCI3675.2~~INCI3675.2.p1  ORF type:complete len:368 (+),score=112.61 INCI3675.2:273-1376(+)
MAEPSAVETQIAALEEKCAEQAKALTALHSLFCELELVAGNNVEAYHKLKVELEEKTQSEVSHLERSQQQQQSDAAAAEEQLRNAVDNEKTDAESKLKAMREAMGEQERELTRLQQLLETQKAEHEKKLAEAMQQQAQSAQDEAAAKASHASLEEASVSAAAAAASRQKEQVEVLKLLRQLMDPAHNNSILAMSNTLEKTVEARAKVMAGRLEQSIGEAKRIAADVTVRAAELQKQAKSNQDHSAAAAQELQSQLAQEQKRIKVLEAKLLGAQAKVDAAENRARAADAARTKHSKDFEVKLAEKTKGLEAQLQAERKKCQTLAGRQQKSLSRQKEVCVLTGSWSDIWMTTVRLRLRMWYTSNFARGY